MVLSVAAQVLPARRHVQVERLAMLVRGGGRARDELLHQGALPFPDAGVVGVHAPPPVARPGGPPRRLRVGSEIARSEGGVAVGGIGDVASVAPVVPRYVP